MNPWLPTSPCTPGCLPPVAVTAVPERLVRAARAAIRAVAVGLVLALGAVVALGLPLLAPATLAAVQRRWALALLTAAGIRLRLVGRAPEPGPGVLVVANHVSWLDVLALHAVAPVRMLAKREVRTWPLVGAMAARAGTVFLDRDRLRDLPAAVGLLAGALRDGGAVGVFAEGTTRCGRALGPFRPAAFQAAVDGGVAVQPVALRYGDGAAAFVGDDTLLSSLRRVLPAPGVELELTVLAPLHAAGTRPGEGRAAVRRDLAARCEAAVAASLAGAAAELPAPTASIPPAADDRTDGVLDRVA